MAYYATYMPNELGELQKVVINAGVGFVLPYYGETAPPGTLACDGSEISRTAYDELFQVLGTKAGAGDGSTTFNLPDLRGQFVRGAGGNAAALGVKQGDAIRDIVGDIYARDGQAVCGSTSGAFVVTVTDETFSPNGRIRTFPSSISFRASEVVPTDVENRPVNVALLWCIIYE